MLFFCFVFSWKKPFGSHFVIYYSRISSLFVWTFVRSFVCLCVFAFYLISDQHIHKYHNHLYFNLHQHFAEDILKIFPILHMKNTGTRAAQTFYISHRSFILKLCFIFFIFIFRFLQFDCSFLSALLGWLYQPVCLSVRLSVCLFII